MLLSLSAPAVTATFYLLFLKQSLLHQVLSSVINNLIVEAIIESVEPSLSKTLASTVAEFVLLLLCHYLNVRTIPSLEPDGKL